MDIMLAPTAIRREEPMSEPLVPQYREEDPAAPAEPPLDREQTEELPIPEPSSEPEKKEKKGDGRAFRTFMLIAAAVLAAIVLIGVMKGLAPADGGDTLSLPLGYTEGTYAL